MPPKPRTFPRSFCIFLSLVPLASFALAPVARAQTANNAQPRPVSDADRAAARELAAQGFQLQQAGSFAEALDRFDRAQAVFSAPTHLLHIAECEAALGKLVEAAETYRTVVQTPLPEKSPNAFVQAQQQAAAELSQVEPRIPFIRVIVRPRVLQGTRVWIDKDEINPALIGVPRPTDPGNHIVVLQAPGYARAEQRVTLQEKETKDLAFNLGGSPGLYAPPPAQPYAPLPPPTTYTAQPQTYPTPQTQTFPTTQPEEYPPPEHHEANGGFMLGATLGVLIPTGNATSGTSLSSLVNAGVAVGLDAGFRFVKRLYLGGTFQHGFMSAASGVTQGFPAGGTASADTNYIGLDFAFLSDPNSTAFFAKIGVGYRYLDLGANVLGVTYGETLSGAEVALGAGVEFKLGRWIRLIPEASLNVGSFGSSSCSSTGSTSFGGVTSDGCGSISSSSTHEFVLIGATLFLDFARKN